MASLDKSLQKNFLEVEIRITPKYYSTNLHPIFNMDEIDLENYSLYNEQNIIFSPHTVFKCLYIDKKNNK